MASKLDASNALHYPGQEYPFETEVPIEDMEFVGDPIHFEDVKVRGVMVGTGERVSIRAEVDTTLATRCSRCLEDVNLPLSAEVDAVFARTVDPDDPDLYVFEASSVDLTDAVRDALIMEIPMMVLCKEDCKGLCPTCGANRNKVSCTCQKGDEIANPFAALKEFVHNDEEV